MTTTTDATPKATFTINAETRDIAGAVMNRALEHGGVTNNRDGASLAITVPAAVAAQFKAQAEAAGATVEGEYFHWDRR